MAVAFRRLECHQCCRVLGTCFFSHYVLQFRRPEYWNYGNVSVEEIISEGIWKINPGTLREFHSSFKHVFLISKCAYTEALLNESSILKHRFQLQTCSKAYRFIQITRNPLYAPDY